MMHAAAAALQAAIEVLAVENDDDGRFLVMRSIPYDDQLCWLIFDVEKNQSTWVASYHAGPAGGWEARPAFEHEIANYEPWGKA